MQLTQEVTNTNYQLISDLPKSRGPDRFRPRDLDWVRDTPVQLSRPFRKHRTYLTHAVAHRNDIMEWLVDELAKVLRLLGADVNAQLGHDADRQRMNLARLAAGTEYRQAMLAALAQNALGHLRAGAVVGAQEEHAPRPNGVCARQRPGIRRNERGTQDLVARAQHRLEVILIQMIVNIATVSAASPFAQQTSIPQLPQVVGHHVLGPVQILYKLVDTKVIDSQFRKNLPTQIVS